MAEQGTGLFHFPFLIPLRSLVFSSLWRCCWHLCHFLPKWLPKLRKLGKLLPVKQMRHCWNGYFLLVFHLKFNKVREMGPMSLPLVKALALTSNVCCAVITPPSCPEFFICMQMSSYVLQLLLWQYSNENLIMKLSTLWKHSSITLITHCTYLEPRHNSKAQFSPHMPGGLHSIHRPITLNKYRKNRMGNF